MYDPYATPSSPSRDGRRTGRYGVAATSMLKTPTHYVRLTTTSGETPLTSGVLPHSLSSTTSVISAFRELQSKASKLEEETKQYRYERDEMEKQLQLGLHSRIAYSSSNSSSSSSSSSKRGGGRLSLSEIQLAEQRAEVQRATLDTRSEIKALDAKSVELEDTHRSLQRSTMSSRSMLTTLEDDVAQQGNKLFATQRQTTALKAELKGVEDRCERLSARVQQIPHNSHIQRVRMKEAIAVLESEINKVMTATSKTVLRASALKRYADLTVNINSGLCDIILSREKAKERVLRLAGRVSPPPKMPISPSSLHNGSSSSSSSGSTSTTSPPYTGLVSAIEHRNATTPAGNLAYTEILGIINRQSAVANILEVQSAIKDKEKAKAKVKAQQQKKEAEEDDEEEEETEEEEDEDARVGKRSSSSKIRVVISSKKKKRKGARMSRDEDEIEEEEGGTSFFTSRNQARYSNAAEELLHSPAAASAVAAKVAKAQARARARIRKVRSKSASAAARSRSLSPSLCSSFGEKDYDDYRRRNSSSSSSSKRASSSFSSSSPMRRKKSAKSAFFSSSSSSSSFSSYSPSKFFSSFKPHDARIVSSSSSSGSSSKKKIRGDYVLESAEAAMHFSREAAAAATRPMRLLSPPKLKLASIPSYKLASSPPTPFSLSPSSRNTSSLSWLPNSRNVQANQGKGGYSAFALRNTRQREAKQYNATVASSVLSHSPTLKR